MDLFYLPLKLKIRVVNLCPYPFLFPLYLALYHFLAVNIGCPHFSYKVLSYIHFRIKINVFSCSLINGHSFCYPVFLPTHRERILFLNIFLNHKVEINSFSCLQIFLHLGHTYKFVICLSTDHSKTGCLLHNRIVTPCISAGENFRQLPYQYCFYTCLIFGLEYWFCNYIKGKKGF